MTRARMETSWRARVVPVVLAWIGTGDFRASTTVMIGGGVRPVSTRVEQLIGAAQRRRPRPP